MGSVQRANTLGEGGIQVGIEPGVKVAASSAGAGFAPDMTVSVQGGITDRLDLGGRIGSNIYDFHMKYMFSDPEGTGPVLSIAPAMSFYAIGTGDGAAMAGHLNLPLLVGLPIGEHQLVFGPRLYHHLWRRWRRWRQRWSRDRDGGKFLFVRCASG